MSRDPNSLALLTMMIINGAIPINVIAYCYLGIYQHFKLVKKSNKTVSTIATTNTSTVQTTDKTEFQIFVTVFVLVGWTLIGNAFLIHD